MRIRVLIPCWKRYDIAKFCFDNLKKLQTESEHTIDVLCVISEDEFIPICEYYNFDWTFYKNDPLGEKINHGLKESLNYQYDYLMVMNSDSVIDVKLFDYYKDHFGKSDYFGVDTVYYLDSESGECRKVVYNFTILGVGKCISRKAIEKLKGKLYRPELNKALDNTMMDVMINTGFYPTIVKYEGQLVFDVKSEVNIWPFEHFKNKGEKVESELCYSRK